MITGAIMPINQMSTGKIMPISHMKLLSYYFYLKFIIF